MWLSLRQCTGIAVKTWNIGQNLCARLRLIPIFRQPLNSNLLFLYGWWQGNIAAGY